MSQAHTACELCARLRGERPQEEPPAGYLYEDQHWLVYHAPVERATLGQLFLISRRHYLDFAEMTADEAKSFGVVMRSLYTALKQVVQAERVYSSIMLEGIPHFHVWLVPRGEEETARGWGFLTSARSCSEEAAGGVVAQLRALLAASGGQTTTGNRTVEQRLYLWADELRAIANEGLHWMADNPYDVSRYQHTLRIAAAMFATQDVRDLETIERSYMEHLGHLTPYAAGDAAIFDQQDRILLIRRKDNGLWAMPGGAFEVGETPAEGACREVWEETGLRVAAVGLSGVYDSRLWQARSAYHLYQFVFLCRLQDSAQQPQVTDETLDVQWYTEHEAAALPLDPNHRDRIAHAFKRWRGELSEAHFDAHSAGVTS